MDISVIVPALNEEKYIGSCLKSIVNQKTKLKYELIVSDGKSTDKTVEIAKKYADKVIICKKKGVAIQRNTGAKIATGKILVFVDSDSMLKPDHLDTIYEAFKDKKVIALSTAFIFSQRSPELKFAETVTNAYLVARSKLGMTTLPGFNFCVRKNIFEKVGGFKNVLLEDIALSRELKKYGRLLYLPEHKAITSSRKLEGMGILETLRYYFELDIRDKRVSTHLKKIGLLKYEDYIHLR